MACTMAFMESCTGLNGCAHAPHICSENTHLACLCVCKQLLEMPTPWAPWHGKCHGAGRRGGSGGGNTSSTHCCTPAHLCCITYTHALVPLLGYTITPRPASNTFIMPVVIRNKAHYAQRQLFMNNICKGCGGSSCPPLIHWFRWRRGRKRWKWGVCMGGRLVDIFEL